MRDPDRRHGIVSRSPAPWQGLARLAASCGHWSEAEACWRRYLTLDDSLWWAHASLAVALRKQDKWDAAEAVLTAVVDRFQNVFRVFESDRAGAAEARGEWSDAVRIWSAVRAMFPNEWPGYAGQAFALRHLGRFVEASVVLARAAELFPNEPGLWNDLGHLAEVQGHWAEAANCWRRFLSLDDQQCRVHLALGKALVEQGLFDDAEAALLAARNRFPDDPADFETAHARIAEARQASRGRPGGSRWG